MINTTKFYIIDKTHFIPRTFKLDAKVKQA